MSVDLTKNYWGRVDVTPLATGATVTDEGQGLISVIEDGVVKVKPSANGAGEVFAGLALYRQLSYTTKPIVLPGTIPATSPYTIESGYTNLISGQVRVYNETAGSEMTLVVGAPATGEFAVNLTTGVFTFNAAQASASVTMYFRYNLTVADAIKLYYQAPVNYPDANNFMMVGVAKGKCRFHVSYFNQAVDWSAVTAGTIRLGANGIISTTAGGATGALIPGAYVVQVPSADNGGFLGIEYNA